MVLTGANWSPNESVHIFVNDDAGQSWSYTTDVVADGGGGFTVSFQLPNWFVALYGVTATGSSGATATTSFTDLALNLYSTAADRNATSPPGPNNVVFRQGGTVYAKLNALNSSRYYRMQVLDNTSAEVALSSCTQGTTDPQTLDYTLGASASIATWQVRALRWNAAGCSGSPNATETTVNFFVVTLKTFSDAACTVADSSFSTSDTVYLTGTGWPFSRSNIAVTWVRPNATNVAFPTGGSRPDTSGSGTWNACVGFGSTQNGGSLAAGNWTVKAASANDEFTSAAFTVDPADTTPPVITPTITGTLGSNGWYRSNVSLSWSVVDNESTITSTSGCGNVSVTADQAATTYTCTATSAGGTASQSVTIKRDATAPSVVRKAADDSCSVPGTNGWCRGTQTAGFTASDATSGLTPDGSSPRDFTQSSATNGSMVSIPSGAVTDMAGNTNAGINAGPFKIDSVDPERRTQGGRRQLLRSGHQWLVPRHADCRVHGERCDVRSTPDGSSPRDFTQSSATNGSMVSIPSGAVTDMAGNTNAGINAGPFKIDSVDPSVVRKAADDSCSVPGTNGWCRGTQTAGFTASDATSGLTPDGSSPRDFTQSSATNGSMVSIPSGAVTDMAGNTNAGINAGPFKIDSVDPSVVRKAADDSCSVPGTNGWCRGTQTAGFTASDATSGLTPDGSSPRDFTQSSATNGSMVSIPSGAVTDMAGNTNAGINAGPFKIDSVDPSVVRKAADDSCSVPGTNGWCRGTQTAGFTASDATSGLTPDGSSPRDFTPSSATNGSMVSIPSGAVTDMAGNTNAGINAGPFKIDSVDPSVVRKAADDSCSVPGTNGWCRGTQTAGFTASDATSGLTPDGSSPRDFTQSSATNGSMVSIPSGAVTDMAGNTNAGINAGPFKIDSVDPASYARRPTTAAPFRAPMAGAAARRLPGSRRAMRRPVSRPTAPHRVTSRSRRRPTARW